MASCLLLACLLSAPAAAQALLTEEPGSKPAPALAFTDAAGKTLSLSDVKGRLIAVHFWATWCTPCVAELPQVDAAAQAYGPKGFTVVAISLDDDGSMGKVKQFMAAHHITHLTPYLDSNASSFQAVQSPGLPTTVFIAGGREIARGEGPLDWEDPAVRKFIAAQLK